MGDGLWDYDDDVEEVQIEEKQDEPCQAVEALSSQEDVKHTAKRRKTNPKEHKQSKAKNAGPPLSLDLDDFENILDDDLLSASPRKGHQLSSAAASKEQLGGACAATTKSAAAAKVPAVAAPVVTITDTSMQQTIAKSMQLGEQLKKVLESFDEELEEDVEVVDQGAGSTSIRTHLARARAAEAAAAAPLILEQQRQATLAAAGDAEAAAAASKEGQQGPGHAPVAEDAGKITVHCQYAGGGCIHIRIKPSDNFGKLLTSFLAAATKKGVAVPKPPGDVKILVDGEKMAPNSTLESQDLEDGMPVDVVWK